MDRGVWSLGKSQGTNKGESPIIKEEGATNYDDAGVQIYIWDLFVFEVYPLVLPQKVKIALRGIY